jgi:hypothetical protein
MSMQDRFKVALCVSSGGHCKPAFVVSIATLTPYLAQIPVYPGVHQQNFSFRIAESSSICDNRQLLVQGALDDDCTHVCFIDDDMAFPRDAIHRLAKWRQPIVAANYRKRLPGGAFVSTKPISPGVYGQVMTTETAASLEEVTGIGFGLCLIQTDIFKQLPQPWFEFRWNPEAKTHIGEDLVFGNACRDAGIPLYIDHDLSREVLHIGSYPYSWNDCAD